jgi:hypothetical protein
VFDISTQDPREHFLQPIILGFLRLPGTRRSDKGFVPVQEIYEYCQGVGFTPEQIDVAVVRSFSKKLVETAARRIPEPGKIDGFAIRPTSIGLYHLQELLGTFTYLDAMVVDTPILDRQLQAYITDAHTLADRVERGFVFREYLDGCWKAIECSHLPFDWPEKSQQALAVFHRLAERGNHRSPE